METKAWYESKTIWVGIIGLGVGIVQAFKPEFKLDPGMEAVIMSLIMIGLRKISNKPVTMLKN